MNQLAHGLREGGLTLAYNGIVAARRLARAVLRPSELGVRAVVARGDAILLVRHRGGRMPWSLPGGGVSWGEPLADAALREVREEAGCAVALGHLLGMYHSRDGGLSNHVGVFVCAALEDASPPAGDLEIADARFFAPGDFPTNTEAGSLRRIAEFRAGAAGLARPW